ncbi:MAG: hypothetical protein WD007_02795 [Nitriliruptoraceae bacterium]
MGRGDIDGPPPTPAERATKRRRKRIIIVVLAVVLAGAAVPGLAWVITQAVGSSDMAVPPAADGDGDAPESGDAGDAPDAPSAQRREHDAERGRPDAEVPDDEVIAAPDPADFAGAEAVVLRVLLDIDASERVMIAFQRDVVAVFEDGDNVAGMLDGVSALAADSIADLLVLRDLLNEPIGDPAMRDVATTYVAHLDTWMDYLEALEEQPQLLGGDMVRYTLPINATGGKFSRAVHARIEANDGLDQRLIDFAVAIVERGFPDPDDAQV